MQYKILIVGAPTKERQEMYSSLLKNKYGVDMAPSSSKAIELLHSENYGLAIFNFDNTTNNTLRTANYFFELYGHIPLLVAAQTLPKDGVKFSEEKGGKIIFIEKPYEDKDFYGIVEKMVQGQQPGQRIHRRYSTNQVAKIEKMNQPSAFYGRVCNLSRGGAYIEHSALRLNVGDFVSLKVELSEVSRNYNVNARVIWASDRNTTGRLGIGVEFIKAKDVYRNLLSRLG